MTGPDTVEEPGSAGGASDQPAANDWLDRVRAARRSFIADQHPDRGGDPDRFIVGLRQFDRELDSALAAAAGWAGVPAMSPGAEWEPGTVAVYRRGVARRLVHPLITPVRRRWRRRRHPRVH